MRQQAVARYAASLSDHLPMLKGGENPAELAATSNLRSCFFADSAGHGYLLRKSTETSEAADRSGSQARLVGISVSVWLMFQGEQKFRSVFCSPGCIYSARIGYQAVFGSHFVSASLSGKLRN